MSRLLKWIEGLALALGGPGLFILSFLDSSFLSFPEVTDILIIVLVTKHPERFLWYTALPTIGSVMGCYVLYALARRGGEAFLRKRMHERHVEKRVRGLPEVRAARGGDPVDPAAAGAVQDVRAGGRGRPGEAVRFPGRCHDRPRHPILWGGAACALVRRSGRSSC